MTSIDQSEFRVLELQRELDEQEERDKDFIMLQRLAEEEVMTNTLKPRATHTEEASLIAFTSLISDNVNHQIIMSTLFEG